MSGGGTVWAIPHGAPGADLKVIRLRGGQWRSISMSGLYPADTIQQDIATTSRTPTRIATAATYGRAMTPPAMLLVSTDAGQNWHRLVDHGLPFSLADSMAIAGDTLYLADVRGQVWRTVVPRWTRLELVPGVHGVTGLQPAGDRVIAWRWRFNELVSIDQTGRVHVIAFKQRTCSRGSTRILRSLRWAADLARSPSTLRAWQAKVSSSALISQRASSTRHAPQPSRLRCRMSNVEFAVGDIYSPAYEAGTFDVVHAHQVLQHLSDPVAALREMGRVCKHEGLIAVRDSACPGTSL